MRPPVHREPPDPAPATDAVPARATPLPSRLRLLVRAGADAGRELVIERGSYHVGKEPTCDLVLTEASVSRRHLAIELRRDGVVVRDLGSKNGSFYRGARISEVTVGPGAVIRVGTVELELVLLDDGAAALECFGGLWGRAPAMRKLYDLIERVAAADAPVLIGGETGTGKELCAEAIHRSSARRGGPFVICDLASVSSGLIESELFGHKRGAFTGADRDRSGAFASAHGGTIFIDEVGELALDAQPRLLRALEQRRIKPVGGSSYDAVDVRVIAATNRDLAAECRAGRFRTDLYHRLAVLRLELPPLRERKEDIGFLVERFAGARSLNIDDAVMARLGAYDWPGNVRELRNVVERALSMTREGEPVSARLLGLDGEAGETAARAAARPAAVIEDFHRAKEGLIDAWERSYLGELLRRVDGNVSRAARSSGLARSYLHRLLKKHGLGLYEAAARTGLDAGEDDG